MKINNKKLCKEVYFIDGLVRLDFVYIFVCYSRECYSKSYLFQSHSNCGCLLDFCFISFSRWVIIDHIHFVNQFKTIFNKFHFEYYFNGVE